MSAAVLSWLAQASLALIPAVVIAWIVSTMLHRRDASSLANLAWIPLPLVLIPMPLLIWPTPVAELPALRVVHDVLSLSAAEEGITGSVTLEARVTADGSLDQVQIVSSEPEGVFDAEAMTAFAQWRFKPATAGEPMRRVHQTIDFELDE